MEKLSALICAILFIYFLPGCTTINQTIYLQNVKVNGPIKAPPLSITKDKKDEQATISVGMSFHNAKTVNGVVGEHSMVNDAGFFQVDTVTINGQRAYKDAGTNIYKYTGNDFQWNQPDFSVFLNADLKLSNVFAFSFGLTYMAEHQSDLYGGNFGFGMFSETPRAAMRIDFGLNWQQTLYEASSVIITYVSGGGSNSNSVTFFEDTDKRTSFTPYITVTYNSKFEDSPVNFFINGGYFTQSLINYSPSTPSRTYYPLGITVITVDKRGEAKAGFLNFMPGLYFKMTNNSRINVGVRFLKETQIESPSKSLFVLPFVQYDVSF